MNAVELVQLLGTRGLIGEKRVKDIRTSLHKLADACDTPLNNLDLRASVLTYEEILKASFRRCSPAPSIYTQRNTLQNLRQLYRILDETGILPRDRRRTPSTRTGLRTARKELVKTSPYKSHYSHGRYRVPIVDWPEEIAHIWAQYCASRMLHIREKTLTGYRGWMACYVGYNLSVERPSVQRWDQLFEPDRLIRFIAWHAKRVGGKDARASVLSRHVLDLIAMLAEHLHRPELLDLRALQRKLPRPAPMHQTKRPEHTFTLQELDAVGISLMEEAQRMPVYPGMQRAKYPGLLPALRYQTGLLVRFWIRVPLRSRSVCDMDLDRRLYRDDHGRWQVYYRGDQLKTEEYMGDINEFRLPWPSELEDPLEIYLRTYRPRIPHADTAAHVFLTAQGQPFSQGAVWSRFRLAIYQATHKRIWPHLLRTIWADAYLDMHPGDWEGAAAMLTNTPQMVQMRYRRFRREQHLQKAINFNVKLFRASPSRKA
jgi:hypothetical protein